MQVLGRNEMELSVLCWNVWVDGNFEQTKDFLHAHPADIICLQEVKDDDPGRDVIGYLIDKGYHHVFAPIEKVWDGRIFRDGPAVFSRYPILASRIIALSQEQTRVAIHVTVDVEGEPLEVFGLHLLHTHLQSSPVVDEQVATLLAAVPERRAIVLGDFNMNPDSEIMQRVQSVLHDADKVGTPTWCQYKDGCYHCQLNQLTHRIDYIFCTHDLMVEDFSVEHSPASDHLPISATIAL